MIANKPLGYVDIWVSGYVERYLGLLQKPEAVLIVFYIPVHKMLTPPSKQEADAPAQL